ncbi:hypothetical protein EKO04_004854 [Ascochyta lentis]|uniref:Uncharacterized protein n=1 Tax=Ascochyta lentis TaxID=205686 RepID=A0A8H7J3H8_9PLEO|nr:hypothetical protein EKO04_004854 [Ascochyta lentis]
MEAIQQQPIQLKIGTIILGLGLKQVNTGPHPGRPVFHFDSATQLTKAITEASTQLPTTLEELLDAATATGYAPVREHVADLLSRFGNEIWGAKKERTWLLQASDGEAEYQKDLVFENNADRDVLAYHLRLWILAKAFNTIRHKSRAAGSVYKASTESQRNRNSAGKSHESSLTVLRALGSTQIPQARTRSDALAAAVNSAAVSFDRLHKEPITFSVNKHLQVRNTAPAPESRSQLGTVSYFSDSGDDVPRHYKGKGRAWRKTEIDEDLSFGIAVDMKPSVPGTKNISLSEPTYKLRDRPERSKGITALFEETVHNEDSDEDRLMRAGEGETRVERLRKDALSAPAHASIRTQERVNKEPNSKRNRKSSRKYLSENTIHNSSDESEEDNVLTHITTQEEVNSVVGTETRTLAPRSDKQYHGSERSTFVPGTEFESQTSPSTLDPPAGGTSVMPLAKRRLPLNEYWDKDTWRFLYLRGNERQTLLQTMRSLGLKVVFLHRVHLSFDKKTFVTLDSDINTVAKTLSSRFSTNEIIRFAADSNYLNEQIDVLLQTHSTMWSLDADRSQLLVPGVEEEYPKHLFYEESEDQRIIWINLHGWIFIIALRNCRQMWGPKVSSMDNVPQPATKVPEETLDEYQLEGDFTVNAPEGSSSSPSGSAGSASTVENDTVADRTLKDCERDLLEAMGQFFEAEGNQRNQDAVSEVSKLRQKRVANSFANTAQQSYDQTSKKRKTTHHSMIDMSDGNELSTLFMSYLELYNDPKFDELAALKNLAGKLSILEQYSTNFHTRKGIDFATAFFVVTFPAWLMYRNDIVKAKRKLVSMQSPEQTSHHHVAVIERSRLATELRQAHDRFMRAGHDGLRSEQVIHRAFITLQNQHGNSQTAEDIRRGFKGMEDELKKLGDELMNEGGKWILSDFASVTNLKGLQPHTRVGTGLYHQYY